MSITSLSVISNAADVTTAFILVSTGVVLLVSHPICTSSDENNNVFDPPLEFTLDTVKYEDTLSFSLFLVKYKYECHIPFGITVTPG
jgi:hypothetical protein